MEKNKITIRLCYIELIIFAGILVTMIFHFRCGFEKSFFALMIIAALAGCGVSLALKDYLKSMIQSSAFDVAGVHNKKALEKQLQQIQDEDDTLDTGIMMFDLNNLKIINDTYGHEEGDVFIQTFASFLTRILTENSYLARFGGDEFLIIQRNTTWSQLEQMNIQLQTLIDEHNQTADHPLSYAVGYDISCKNHYYLIMDLLKIADEKMYQDKKYKKQQLAQKQQYLTKSGLAQSISSLNKQINQIQANYGNANDLKDQRNALIDDLSKLVNISVSETDIGNNLTDLQITINGNSLVNGYNYHTLQTVSRDEPRNVSDAAGLYDIQWETGQPFNIYSTSLGGELKGLIDIRDGCNGEIEKYATTTDDDGNETYKTDAQGNILTDTVSKVDSNTNYKGVPYYQAQLNQFIQTFVSSINEILTKGVTSDGSASGIPLFVMSDGSKALTASSVTVNQDLIDNADLLATKYKESDGEANTSLIVDLINSKDAKIYDGGTGTYFLESIVSDMSIDASKAINFTKNYNNLKTTIQNQRLSVMGVDTDEEAMDLVKFQQAYNLSSKMMTVMNQLYDRLINNTGV